MSRCYPYPLLGYEKKANGQLALSPKKEKHNHKDKKRKRRKDSETNGDLQRDSDKRSKKSQQRGVLNEGICLANGCKPDTKAILHCETVHEKVTQKVQVHEKVTQKVQAASLNAEVLSVGVLAVNGKQLETITKQGQQLSLVSVRAACNSNGAAVTIEAAPSLRTSSKSERRESHTQYIPRVEKVWSPLDDQEWLFHHNGFLPSVSTNKLDESQSSQMRAVAILLPSVGIYALPYVVPDR